MPDFRRVTEDFYVSPQLDVADLPAAAAAGFRTVVRNRPDGEQPGQVTAEDVEAAAKAAGLAFHSVVLTSPSAATPADIAALETVIRDAPGPVLAYCRSGTRSVTLWALAVVKSGAQTPEAAIEAARGAGYDLSAMAATLRSLAP
ncbi:MAG: TIGR01244 family sulfur transferase [Alphaproteobacteria bacterium]|nr:TIGR01244 family sulfur transferase [Alphaproteobacteria bacterium]